MLLAINVAVFFLFYLSDTQTFIWGILNLGAIPSYIVAGERLWTLLSSTFMHADLIHLFGNMLYLWVFGDNIEDAIGHGKYLLFYLVGGIIASVLHVASVAVSTPGNGLMRIPSVGASGAVSAVLGAYLILYPKARIRTLIIRFFITIVDVRAMFYLGFWFIYQFLMGIISLTGIPSNIAFWAHIGGFLFGALIAKVSNVKSIDRAIEQRVIRIRKCDRCGYENKPEAYYCSWCGSILK